MSSPADGKGVSIADEAAVLVQLLHQLGLKSAAVYVDSTGQRVEVVFIGSPQAERFLETIAHHLQPRPDLRFTDPVYARMSSPDRADAWQTQATAVDFATAGDEAGIVDTNRPAKFCFAVSVHIPRADMMPVLQALSRAIDCLNATASAAKGPGTLLN